MQTEPGHILFVTSVNLASNPRCLKEIKLAKTSGYKVSVLAFEMNNWSVEIEGELKNELSGVELIYLSTGKKNIFSWMTSVVSYLFFRFLSVFLKKDLAVNCYAFDRRCRITRQFLERTKLLPGLVVVHNPPVFYPAVSFAKKNHCPWAIDVEDYHPGETAVPARQDQLKVMMKSFLPEASYVSYASPLIKEYSEKLTGVPASTGIVINNVFPRAEFTAGEPVTGNKIKMVWFSQYISYYRGLEKILSMLDAFSETIELTLIGKADQLFFDQHLSVRPYVQVEAPVKSEALHRSLSRFDIGLAVEDINAGLNRNICLTNKIFAYLQAGLLILATATEAQKKFLAQNPAAGYIIDEPAFPVLMNKIILEKELIRENKKKRSGAAARFCWENESLLLLEKWKSVTGKNNNS